MSPSSSAFALIALGLTAGTLAQVMNYNHVPLARTRMDPIVSPGGLSGHVHVFGGTNALDSKMTFESATGADCTTSAITVDKSGYWAPQLYYKWRNGTYTAIPGSGIISYWFFDRGMSRADGDRLAIVPDDFRIVAGDMNRDHYDAKISSHNAVQFRCWGDGVDEENYGTLPTDHDCPNLRPQIFFPSCWNGVDSYKPDNSHVTYPVGGPGDFEHGKCPAGFVKIPALFIETFYTPKATLGPDYEWYPGCLMFSNGDTTGLSFHADWLNGFPSGLLADVYDQCPTMSGDPNQCPLLAPYDNKNRNCQIKGQIVNEPVGMQTPLAKLPGNNPDHSANKADGKPKNADPAYNEASSLITFNAAQGGGCGNGRCNDYIGPRNAPPAGNPVAPPAPNPAPPAATSVAGGGNQPSPIKPVTPPTGSAAPVTPVKPPPIDGGLNAEPIEPAVPAAPNPSGGDEEMVCTKRKRRRSRFQK